MYLRIVLTIIAICLISLNIKVWTPDQVNANNHWATKDDIRNEIFTLSMSESRVKSIVERSCRLAIPLYKGSNNQIQSRRITCKF